MRAHFLLVSPFPLPPRPTLVRAVSATPRQISDLPPSKAFFTFRSEKPFFSPPQYSRLPPPPVFLRRVASSRNCHPLRLGIIPWSLHLLTFQAQDPSRRFCPLTRHRAGAFRSFLHLDKRTTSFMIPGTSVSPSESRKPSRPHAHLPTIGPRLSFLPNIAATFNT